MIKGEGDGVCVCVGVFAFTARAAAIVFRCIKLFRLHNNIDLIRNTLLLVYFTNVNIFFLERILFKRL